MLYPQKPQIEISDSSWRIENKLSNSEAPNFNNKFIANSSVDNAIVSHPNQNFQNFLNNHDNLPNLNRPTLMDSNLSYGLDNHWNRAQYSIPMGRLNHRPMAPMNSYMEKRDRKRDEYPGGMYLHRGSSNSTLQNRFTIPNNSYLNQTNALFQPPVTVQNFDNVMFMEDKKYDKSAPVFPTNNFIGGDQQVVQRHAGLPHYTYGCQQ